MTQPVSLTILGATGSIGTQTLDVVSRFPELFSVFALSAGNNLERLASQIQQFHPRLVCIQDESRTDELRKMVPGFNGEILSGESGLSQLAAMDDYETLVVGLVGMRGMLPTLEALRQGKTVLTANKETFVAGGHLVKPYLSQIIPIDSEHSAIYQCLKNEPSKAINTLYLTASGGPFRDYTPEQMQHISVADALNHPNWVMGSKVTIDSATLMNKGLEVIEAHWLFNVDYDDIQIVLHPQSIIHSGIEFTDASVLMQLGAPDMRVPIQYALGQALPQPRRLTGFSPESKLNLFEAAKTLDLKKPDPKQFPCYMLAYEAGRMGSSATAVLNAADEVAVELFLQEKLSYLGIAQLLEKTLSVHQDNGLEPSPSLEAILELDQWARQYARQYAQKHASPQGNPSILSTP